ncbi:hypothetical protein [Herbiconiux sp. UC225_62]|uniref:MmyB family transcriptional regulator n=1 Tax=Herbiconiux sp. UC225_62 TaxID=3350168 RepID=UPI0036D34898
MPNQRQEIRDRAEGTAFIESLTGVPAFGLDKHLTIFAANRLATAVMPTVAVGANLARSVFLGDEPRHFDAGWGLACEHVSAALRASLDRHGEDDEFILIVGELAALSPEFNSVWARNAPPTATGTFRFLAHDAGRMALTYERTSVSDGSGDAVVTWQPADEMSAELLRQVSPPEA